MTHEYTDKQREDGLRSISCALRNCGMGILVGLLLPASLVAQQAGDLDTSFGAGGKVLIDIGGSNDEGSAVTLQPDGKIVMAGLSNLATGFVEFAVTRNLPDGNLDASFGGDGIVTTSFGATTYATSHTVALQPDGKIIAAGSTVNNATGTRFALARYLPNGSLDRTFSGDGKLTIEVGGGYVNAIVVQPNGKIVAVGTTALARFHSDGTLDTTFGTAGVVTVDFEQRAAARQPDGKIVTAGQTFNVSTSQYEFALARFRSNGTLDTTFSGDGRVNTDLGGTGAASAVALQPDGKIIAAGSPFSVADGQRDFGLVRYLPDGTLDTTFGGDGVVTTNFGSGSGAAAVVLQPDAKIVAAGYAGVFALARYLPNGALDATFSDDGLVTTNFGTGDSSGVRGLVMQPNDGRLVAVGSSTRSGEGGFDFALARYQSGLVGPPTNKEQCKHGGWREFTIPRTFKNQGDCISFVNTGQ